MKIAARLGIVGCLLALGFARLSAATDPQAAIDAWQAGRSGGIAVALINGNEVTFHQAGRIAAKDARLVSADTLFEIGSVTKVFTAILLADAIERGLVKLDDPVGAPFPPTAVTYRQLATHTAGLPRLPVDFTMSDRANPYAEQTLELLIKSFAAAAATAKPAPQAYSNLGFSVLGQAAAAAHGATWSKALQTRVLDPLGLCDTALSTRDADPRRLAPGHANRQRVPHWTFDAYAPTGALVSSARDMARFARAVLGTLETPVNPAIARTMQRVIWDDNAARNRGLAWVLERRNGEPLTWHNGTTGGFRSFVGVNAAKKTGVVVLSNDAAETEPLGYTLLTGEPLVLPKRGPPVVAAALEPLLGKYLLTPAFAVMITAEGNQLYLQATDQGRNPLKRVSENRYAIEGLAEVEFERASGGREVTGLVLHQNGGARRAPRIE